jgi:hypothetical protein
VIVFKGNYFVDFRYSYILINLFKVYDLESLDEIFNYLILFSDEFKLGE